MLMMGAQSLSTNAISFGADKPWKPPCEQKGSMVLEVVDVRKADMLQISGALPRPFGGYHPCAAYYVSRAPKDS